ncbi:ATP-binding response regulator [Rubripirellula reticaptiva]|nr:response regulator [Rubripirellula reticaptiva]
MTGTPHILIVDDSPTQLYQMQIVLEQDGFVVRTAENAEAALVAIAAEMPLLVVTDLEMPGMSGLELVETLHYSQPGLPLVLTTSEGSEDVAAEALRRGASSYVPKRIISTTLCPVIRQVLSVNQAAQSVREVAQYAVECTLKLKLSNDETLVPSVIARLELPVVELGLFDDGERMQVAMALDEALVNAIVHGNLEVSSELRQIDDGQPYVDMIAHRKTIEPYKDRKLHVYLHATSDQVTFTIRDEGNGFSCADLRDPTNPENLERAGGRGLLLIHAFMDEVRHNDEGNEITMIKRKKTDEEKAAEAAAADD